MKKLYLSFSLCFLFLIAQSQSYEQQSRELFFYNTAFGAVVSGIGSGIHKHKNEKFIHAFANGFWKGCIGGAMNYEAKCFTWNMNKNLWYGWGSILINAAGTSVIINGINNEKIFSEWQIELGYFQLSTKNNFQLRPFALGGFIYSLTESKFDFSTSIKTGKLFFTTHENISDTKINSITIGDGFSPKHFGGKNQIIQHEFIHALQEEQFSVINNYLNLKFIPKWISLDIPFSDILYLAENKISPPRFYNSNIFEFEANSFSEKIYIER